MQCPDCGYMVGGLDKDCPRCAVGALLHRLVLDTIVSGKDLDFARRQAEHVARTRAIPPADYHYLLAGAWNAALDHCLSDGKFTQAEMSRMQEACFRLGVSTALLQGMGVPQKVEDFKRRTAPESPPPRPHPAPGPIPSVKASSAKSRTAGPRTAKPGPLPPEWDVWLDEEARWIREAKRRRDVP